MTLVGTLRAARREIDAVIALVADGGYRPDVVPRLSVVQGALEQANRTVLRHHVETCVVSAVAAGRTRDVLEGLIEALSYDRVATGPTRGSDDAASDRGDEA